MAPHGNQHCFIGLTVVSTFTPRLHLEPEVDICSKLTPNATGWSVLGLKRFPLIGRPTRAVEPFKRAGNGGRTHGLNLGKVPLYH